jgi:hypothetical protein
MQHSFVPGLKIAASIALLERGCVQVIGLSGLKTEIGGRWGKLKESIWAHMETLLRQKLGPTDFYAKVDETAYLVTMPSANVEEAQIFCMRIAHELYGSLLGRCEIGKLEIARATKMEDDLLYTAPVVGDQLRLLGLRAGLEKPTSEEIVLLKSIPRAGAAAPQSKFSHKFVPLWDAQKEAITTSHCVSTVEQGAAEGLGMAGRARFEISLTVSRMRRATSVLAAHLASGDRFLVSIPLAYDVLSSPVGRMEIFNVCRSLTAELRPYLIFEVSELPLGVPQSRLTELVGSLRPFCRGVTTQLPARIPNCGAYLGAGLHAIGMSLRGVGTGGGEMNSEIFKLCAAAKRQSVRSYALDVPNIELLRSAYAQGINLMSGPLIGPAQDLPAPVRRLSACDLLKKPKTANSAAA